MAYLGADSGDSDEIRRIVEHDGIVVEDHIAYFGTAGPRWQAEQRSTYIADGLESLPGRSGARICRELGQFAVDSRHLHAVGRITG